MAADEKPKEQVPQAERAWKWNLKHKVSFLIRIMAEFRTQNLENVRAHVRNEDRFWQDRRRASVLRPGRARGGEVSTEVGLKERNDDAEVLSCSQNGLTQIRFD